MLIETGRLISAGKIGQETGNYVVVVADDHPTLVQGDVVTMRGFNSEFVLVKLNDFTLHNIKGEDGYVLLIKETDEK